MRKRSLLLPLIFGMLSACGSGDASSGGLTPDQNKALDNAAQRLDAQRADLPKRDGAEAPTNAKTSPDATKANPRAKE